MAASTNAPKIISMEFSTNGRSDNYYRILAGKSVKYVTVQAGALDADSLYDMPLDFQNILPALPYGENHWTQALVSRNPKSGKLESRLSRDAMVGVTKIWHSKMVDFLDLERIKQLSPLTQECRLKKGSATSKDHSLPEQSTIVKAARFHWEVQYVEKETKVYQLLESSGIAPRFLGHVHEAGRVIGLLIEKVQGRPAGVEDLEPCSQALRRLHALGVLHGDCNRYNFIVRPSGKVTMIDFECAQFDADPKLMAKELAGLKEKFQDESGLGGGFRPVDSE